MCVGTCPGGTFALYSLITRYAGISTPGGGSPNASDQHLSRYTSAQMIDNSTHAKPRTLGQKARTPLPVPNTPNPQF